MVKTYDVAIIGGGIIGMATGHYLAKKGLKVCVIERKHIGSGSTGRCIAGIRQQFSTKSSINLMQQSIKLFSQMQEEFGFSVEFHQSGYLFLAHDPKMVEIFKNNISLQKKEGVNVEFISPDEISRMIPELSTEDLLGGAFCPDDAQAFPFAILKGYYNAILAQNGVFYLDNPLMNIEIKSNFLITMQDGNLIEAQKVLLAAGPWTAEIAKKLNLNLPLYPERHEAVITSRMKKLFEPMIVDYRPDGCYFQQLLTDQVIGCYTPVPNVPGIREDASFEFLGNVARRMTRLVKNMENASFLRQWAGSYTMTPDGNPIVDQSAIKNLYIASGMSGHGFMFGPAVGINLAEFMVNGIWPADLSEFSINRSFHAKETMK